MTKPVKNAQAAANPSPICESPEYLQCAMRAADEGVKLWNIKEYCGCQAAQSAVLGTQCAHEGSVASELLL